MRRVVSMATFRRSPWYVRGANALLSLGSDPKLDKGAIISKARRRTGLIGLDEGIWEEALERLLISINNEARLSPIGRIMVREQILGRMEQRLWAEHWFRKYPEILEQEPYPVWLITGLQRTGTTRLQRLLGADPQSRSLLSWESMFPVPLLDNWKKRDRRIAKTRQAATALSLIKPDFYTIHPIEPMEPEEDVLMLDISFMSTSWEAMMHVPSFAAWLEKADNSAAYEYEVRLLKFLQWQNGKGKLPGTEFPLRGGFGGRRCWILKSPHHLEWLDVIREVFPEVKFIWTHRDERDCTPSFLSMLAHGRAMFSDTVEVEELTRHWLRKNRLILDKANRFREQHPEAIFKDVHYVDMMADGLSQIKGIYEAFDRECPVGLFKQAILNEAESRSRHVRHVYRAGDFGL